MFDGDGSSSVCARVLAMAHTGCAHIHALGIPIGFSHSKVQELSGPACVQTQAAFICRLAMRCLLLCGSSQHTYTHTRHQPWGPGTSTAKLLQSALPITMSVRVCGPRTHAVGPGSGQTGPLFGLSGLGPILSGAGLGDVHAWLPPVSALVLQRQRMASLGSIPSHQRCNCPLAGGS